MSFTLVNSDCVDLTPQLARQFNELEPSPTERELDPKRVKHLEKKATDGLLVTFHWAKATLKGRSLRMNGQHSSTMLCGLDGNFPAGLKVHVDEYRVDSDEDLAMLFRQFDDRVCSRGASDVAGAWQNLFPALHNVPRKSAKLALDGVGYYNRIVEGAPTPSGDDLYVWFNREALWPFIVWVGEVMSMKTPELTRREVTAAMYATWTANQEEAKAFWLSVARGGDEYDEQAPATVLDGWYKSAKAKEIKEAPKPADFYQAAMFAWNAFIQQKPIKSIKTDSSKGWTIPLTSA